MPSRTLTAALCSLGLIAVSGCGASDSGAGGTGADGKLDVVTSMYPLQFAVQQIGGDRVSVRNLVKPGQEPHDLELKPKDVAQISDAALFVYQKGIAGAVDSSAGEAGDAAMNIAPDADLSLKFTRPALDTSESDHSDHDHDHSDSDSDHEHETETGATDPHFWMDPVRYAKVATAIADRLAKVDPEHAAEYRRNATTFTGKLTTLTNELKTGLATCTDKDLVTSHAAFGYLAQRTGLTQIPIAGLSPGQEPETATLTAISTFVKANKVSTIYTETLASPAFAQTVARASGAKTAVLDPIEGLTSKTSGQDYFSLMRANLKTLRAGQSCS
ncbi:metal ABC transporter substrate-binding protein [Dermacoccaceae bacterium W4C1]